MTKAPKPFQATMKSLWREFRRCSNVYPPLYHELFQPWPDLSDYHVDDICESFRTAFADRFQDDWEEWHGPDDVEYFGRFFGNEDGLEEFKTLAESAYLAVCEVGPTDPEQKREFPSDHGYHGWLKLLSDMAYGYPTPLLRSEFAVWDEKELAEEDVLARVGTPEGGGTIYPLHPFHMRLVHPVFTSSMAAIEIILDDERGLLIGDPQWGLPISFSGRADEVEIVTPPKGTAERAEPAGDWEDGFFGPVRQFSYDGAVWTIDADAGDEKEPQRFLAQGKGFALYREILRQPERMISPVDLLYYTGQIKMAVLGTEEKGDDLLDKVGIADLRRKLAELKEEIDATDDSGRRAELERERRDLLSAKKSVQNQFGRPRRVRTPYEELTNVVLGQLMRARNKIATKMPKFAAYLRNAVRQKGADFYYFP